MQSAITRRLQRRHPTPQKTDEHPKCGPSPEKATGCERHAPDDQKERRIARRNDMCEGIGSKWDENNERWRKERMTKLGKHADVQFSCEKEWETEAARESLIDRNTQRPKKCSLAFLKHSGEPVWLDMLKPLDRPLCTMRPASSFILPSKFPVALRDREGNEFHSSSK